jgi:succinylarginine dihydrolase
MKTMEVNFDGIVGPTHNYSGLSFGNIASKKSEFAISNPKEAALQGLEKMKFLADKGIPQALLPPHARPHIPTLKELGFNGNDQQILEQAYRHFPEIIYACCSAACMWTANAATVSPSSDTQDGKLHLTPANLSSKFHRSIEAPFTTQLFQMIFNEPSLFTVHPSLPQGTYFADEGAANHNRFCSDYSQPGLELFVWGRYGFRENPKSPHYFPARHTFEASQAIARNHLLPKERVLFAQQNPDAIDAGVFHNDVISVANENVFLCHEEAFVETKEVIKHIRRHIKDLILIEVPEKRISLENAVATYLFNSQIVTLPNKAMHMIAPTECRENPVVHAFLQEMISDPSNPINGIDYLNLHQSMANGGGPACLRLRVVMNQNQLKAMHQGILLTDKLYLEIKQWIEKHYRERLHPHDLADRQLLLETQAALDELTQILKLGPIYHFQ